MVQMDRILHQLTVAALPLAEAVAAHTPPVC
jgi:hypothetical protein